MMRAALVAAALLAVPGSGFLVPGSGSGFELRTRPRNQEPGTRNAGGLPNRETFLREAREALARSQQVWHRYAYKERRTDVHMNPFGRMGTGDTRVVEVRPSPNPQLTYRRVIERNGAPVSKQELDRQDADYRARVEQVRKRAADGDADAENRREQEELLARRRAQMVIDDVLNTLQFDVVRRELRDGRPTIVVSFAAKPDVRPVTRQGRIAKVFKGHAFVDEDSREVIAVDAVAVDDVSFGGFIAKLYDGTRAVLRREQIEPNVWMPTRVHLSGDVRALFRKTKIDYVIEWFDYRRLSAGELPTHSSRLRQGTRLKAQGANKAQGSRLKAQQGTRLKAQGTTGHNKAQGTRHKAQGTTRHNKAQDSTHVHRLALSR
jgi:hypothetical protein